MKPKEAQQQETKSKTGQIFDLQGKVGFLIIFAVIYGLVFINYIDIMTPGGNDSGYHLWLAIMYFLPFVGLSIVDIKNWRLTLGLGLVVSLMNDVFYGSIYHLFHPSYSLTSYYYRWLIPQGTILFHENLGFAVFAVPSWLMSATIYARVAASLLVLHDWQNPLFDWRIHGVLASKNKIPLPQPTLNYEPELLVLPPEIEEQQPA